MDFNNKLALITGGSSGIGLALAKQLLTLNCNVAILARTPEVLEKARVELEKIKTPRIKLYIIQADVSDETAIKQKLREFIIKAGTPDILINSAGVTHPGEFLQLDEDIFRWNMDINYFGTVYVTKVVVPEMVKRGTGTIVNIASAAAYQNIYGYSAYGASKYAVSGLTEALRMELAPKGIQLCLVFPPDTDTPQLVYDDQHKPYVTKALGSTGGRIQPEVVARDIIQGIARKRYVIVPGTENKIMYFLINLLGRNGVHLVTDLLIRDALRKQARSKN